ADALTNAYDRAKLRFETSRNDNTGKMNVILKIEKVSLKDKIKQVISVLTNKSKVYFSEIFNLKKNTKAEVVTGFLAILELDRNKSVRLEQKKLFGEINIIKAKDDMQEGLTNLEGYDEWD
ncbi:MAG: segregation/condensation protein A, partial [Clostridia bacterium]|nr:segregation/condensation protein A [Clostridia bacterium]